jgi:hypothetical protein
MCRYLLGGVATNLVLVELSRDTDDGALYDAASHSSMSGTVTKLRSIRSTTHTTARPKRFRILTRIASHACRALSDYCRRPTSRRHDRQGHGAGAPDDNLSRWVCLEANDSTLDGEAGPERQQHSVFSGVGRIDSEDVFEHEELLAEARCPVCEDIPAGAQLCRSQCQPLSPSPTDGVQADRGA